MKTLKQLRQHRGMSLADVAARLDVTRATVQGYERRDESGSIAAATRQRVLTALGVAHQTQTRDQTRSLLMHLEIAARLISDPGPVLAIARQNLERWSEGQRHDQYWIDRWERILAEPPARIALLLIEQSQDAADLRQGTPFAGVLDADARRAAMDASRELDITGMSQRCDRPCVS